MKKMTCEEARENMSYYLDGLLSAEEREAMDGHFESCPGCKREMEDLKLLVSELHEIPELPVPERFDLRFRQALSAELLSAGARNEKKRKRPVWRAMSAAAAVMVVGLLSYGMLKDGLSIGEKFGADEMSGANLQLEMSANVKPDELCLTGEEDGAVVASDSGEAAMKQNTTSVGDVEREDTASGARNAPVPESAESAPIFYSASDPEEGEPNSPAPRSDGSAAADTAGTSRGGHSISRDEYKKACTDWLNSYTKALSEKDRALFTDVIAKDTGNGYTTDTADSLFDLYEGYFSGNAVTYQETGCDKTSLKSCYVIKGNGKSLNLTITTTSSGLLVSETIMDHGAWLSTQMEGPEVLDSFEIRGGGTEILFNVRTADLPQPETTTGTAADAEDAGGSGEQVRGILWTKTE